MQVKIAAMRNFEQALGRQRTGSEQNTWPPFGGRFVLK
ncbi:hypothetical protein TRICHSKD4_2918 [Roseibium sp. TrichSKD4]|nr:hypothetical protein TRICHSKD4_2918 [Roseibium sp. TrichSKD4]